MKTSRYTYRKKMPLTRALTFALLALMFGFGCFYSPITPLTPTNLPTGVDGDVSAAALSNQSVSGVGTNIWYSGKADASRTQTISTPFSGTSSYLNMPTPTTGSWTVTGANLGLSSVQENNKNWANPVGNLSTYEDWQSSPNIYDPGLDKDLVASTYNGTGATGNQWIGHSAISGDILENNQIEEAAGGWQCSRSHNLAGLVQSYGYSYTWWQSGPWFCESRSQEIPVANRTSTHVYTYDNGWNAMPESPSAATTTNGTQDETYAHMGQYSRQYIRCDSTANSNGDCSGDNHRVQLDLEKYYYQNYYWYLDFSSNFVKSDFDAGQIYLRGDWLYQVSGTVNNWFDPGRWGGGGSSNHTWAVFLSWNFKNNADQNYNLWNMAFSESGSTAYANTWQTYDGSGTATYFNLYDKWGTSTGGTYRLSFGVSIRLQQSFHQPYYDTGSELNGLHYDWSDSVDVYLKDWHIIYNGLKAFPTYVGSYLETVDDKVVNLRDRTVLANPTILADIYAPEVGTAYNNNFLGAKVAVFISFWRGSSYQTYTYLSTMTMYDLLHDGKGGVPSVPSSKRAMVLPLALSREGSSFMNDLGSSKFFKIGLGLYIESTFKVTAAESPDGSRITWYWDNIAFLANTRPTPADAQLVWRVETANSFFSPFTVTGSTPGSGSVSTPGGTSFYLTAGPQFRTYITTNTTDLTLQWTITASVTSVIHDTGSFQVDYAASDSATIVYTLNMNTDIPRGSGIPDATNYNASFYMNISIPRYTFYPQAPNAEIYWQLLKARDQNPLVPPNELLPTYDYDTWVGAPAGYALVRPNNTNTYIQIIQFDKAAYQYQLARPAITQIQWNMNFTAPNDALSLTIDRQTNFATPDTQFFLNEKCWALAAWRQAVATQNMELRWFKKAGPSWSAVNIGSALGNTSYNTVDYNTGFNLTGADVLGPGYTAVFSYNATNVYDGGSGNQMFGIYRVGYRVRTFEVVRPALINLQITNRIYDVNNASQNNSAIIISATWTDAATLQPVTGADVTATITVDSWVASTDQGLKKPVHIFDWLAKPLNYFGSGNYSAHAIPQSEWRTILGQQGNISQGFKNFTITLSKPGYLTQILCDNFTIARDSYLWVISPDHNSRYVWPNNEVHYLANDAVAGENVTLLAEMYERTPSDLDSDAGITNQTIDYYGGAIRLQYELVRITDISDGSVVADTPVTVAQNVNWSWIASNLDRNYHNGSFETYNNQFRARLYFPTYRNNTAGYSSATPERVFWYNITYWIVRNLTLGNAVGTDLDGRPLFPAGFQPDILPAYNWSNPTNYIKKGCENSTMSGYNEQYPSKFASNMGKVVEEVTLIRLRKEGTTNTTTLALLTNNASDAGWAYSMAELPQASPVAPFSWKTPTIGLYQIRNYVDNETVYSGIEFKNNNRTDIIRFRVTHNCTYTTNVVDPDNDNPWVPPCGPLNSTTAFSWDGPTTIFLYNWNSSIITLTPDPSYLWNITFQAHDTTHQSPSYFDANIYGVTYVTPWLNLTEHGVVSYGNNLALMPYIKVAKNGYLDSMLYLNVSILSQETNLTIQTNTPPVVEVSKNQPYNSVYANVTIPIGTMRSFNITYRDVTNALYVPWASNNSYLISGATISVQNIGDDFTEDKIYYYNRTATGDPSWWYKAIPGQPGKYNVTVYVPEGVNFDITGVDQTKQKNVWFTIYKDQYAAKGVHITLNITRRAIQMQLKWIKNSGVTVFSPRELYSIADARNINYMVLSYSLWDAEMGTYIDLDSYVLSPDQALTVNALDTYDWSDKIAQMSEDNSLGYPVYNISLWPTTPSGQPLLDVLGGHPTRFGFSVTKNLAATNNDRTIQIAPVATQFILTSANQTHVQYTDMNLPSFVQDNMPSFKFQLVDLNHTAIIGAQRTWPEITASASYLTQAWTNPASTRWTNDFDLQNTLLGDGYMRNYTIYFEIENVDSSTTMKVVQFQLARANFNTVTVNFAFYIDNATTDFAALSVNGLTFYDTGVVLWDDGDEKDIAWGDLISITFKYQTIREAFALSNYTAANATMIGFTGVSTTNVTWLPNHQTASPGTYSISIMTNRTDIDISGNGYNFRFEMTVSKPNFAARAYAFNVSIRQTSTVLNLHTLTDTDNILSDYNRSVVWGENLELYMEFLAYETHNPATDIFLDKYSSLDNIWINNTPQTFNTPWYWNGNFIGSFNFTKDVRTRWVLGTPYPRYLFHLTVETTRLNITDVPDGVSLTFNVTLEYYLTQWVTLNLTLKQRGLETTALAYASAAVPDRIDTDEYTSFTFKLQLFAENVKDPDAPTLITDDLFDVTFEVMWLNPDTFTLEPLKTPVKGTMTWDPMTNTYVVTITVTADMDSSRYIVCNITSKTGNYKDVVLEHYVYFVKKVEVWSPVTTLMLIIACTMIGIVSVFLAYKALQLRIPLVLRLIDETIDKIQKDKYPAETGVLKGRNEFMVNTLLDRLEQVGIEWEKAEKFTIESTEGKGDEKLQAPMNLQEINAALDTIPELTVEEKAIFGDELKRLPRKEQDEFIKSLKHES